MGTNDDALVVRTLLDPRSYRVYQMRTKQKKSFREIGAAIGRTRELARQLYHASLRRIELRKSGGENNPEFALKTRAVNCLYRTFDKREITKSEVIEALKSGTLRPAGTYGYGWKTHREVCQWAGVSLENARKTHQAGYNIVFRGEAFWWRDLSMDEPSITAGLLKRVMSAISEDRWCAGWLHDLEYRLWEAVNGKRTNVCSLEEIEQLKYLSEKCRGWIVWDKQSKSEKFVPMQEWLRLYEAHSRDTSSEK